MGGQDSYPKTSHYNICFQEALLGSIMRFCGQLWRFNDRYYLKILEIIDDFNPCLSIYFRDPYSARIS